MKRIFTLFIAFAMMLCLASCGEKTSDSKVYTYKNDLGTTATLTINGNKATFVSKNVREGEDIDGKPYTYTQETSLVGFITISEDGLCTFEYGKEGCSTVMKIKIEGEGAAAVKADLIEQASGIIDEELKQARIDLINGKSLTLKFGDKLWKNMGPPDGQVQMFVIDEKTKTFTITDEQ